MMILFEYTTHKAHTDACTLTNYRDDDDDDALLCFIFTSLTDTVFKR